MTDIITVSVEAMRARRKELVLRLNSLRDTNDIQLQLQHKIGILDKELYRRAGTVENLSAISSTVRQMSREALEKAMMSNQWNSNQCCEEWNRRVLLGNKMSMTYEYSWKRSRVLCGQENLFPTLEIEGEDK